MNSYVPKCLHVLLLLLVSINILSQSQVNPADLKLTSENQLADKEYLQKIETFYDSGEEGTFEGAAGVEIYYRYFRHEDEKGAIVLSTGRTEGAVKYQELIYDLFNNGYSVYIHDHRGQGQSGRMADDPEMGHVDDFQYYVYDMKTFMDKFVKPGNHQDIYLLAHSMGGTIGMSYLEMYPKDFTAAAFSSPMLGLSAYICPLAKILSGKTPKYAPGQTGYTNDSSSFNGNSVTGSEIRYYQKISAYEEVPEAKVGGPSIQWLEESCKQMKFVSRNIDKIEVPVLLFAAENETVVNPKAYAKFCKKAGKKQKECELVNIQDAKHELLMEKDPQRNEVLNKIHDFYTEH